jgi:hypothetical protein
MPVDDAAEDDAMVGVGLDSGTLLSLATTATSSSSSPVMDCDMPYAFPQPLTALYTTTIPTYSPASTTSSYSPMVGSYSPTSSTDCCGDDVTLL